MSCAVTTVGLIISTYNWPAALDRMLASVARQSRPPDEVIVADDGSTQETSDLVASWRPRLTAPLQHCWQEDRGYRLARVRNLALRRATADYLLWLDGDQMLHRHFVRDHLVAARPKTVVRGSRAFLAPERSAVALATGRLPHWWQSGVSKHAAALRLPPLFRLLLDWRPRHVEGHNLACWREDAIAVNGFEEEFEGWGGEDGDFVARLLHHGLRKRRIRFGGVVYHFDHPLAAREDGNERRLGETMRSKRIRAIRGLDQHREPSEESPSNRHS